MTRLGHLAQAHAARLGLAYERRLTGYGDLARPSAPSDRRAPPLPLPQNHWSGQRPGPCPAATSPTRGTGNSLT